LLRLEEQDSLLGWGDWVQGAAAKKVAPEVTKSTEAAELTD